MRVGNMEMIVLAGGLGTRLKSVVADRPKPMAEVCGRPFLCYILDWALLHGARRFVLAVSHRDEVIRGYFGEQYHGVPIRYAKEEVPMGTGGGIKNALSLTQDHHVAVVNGDTLFRVELAELMRAHMDRGARLTIAARVMPDVQRYGRLVTDTDGRLLAVSEKGESGPGLINGGIYCLDRELLERVGVQKFSFEKDILEKIAGQDGVYTAASDAYFIDIGIPEDYSRANRELADEALR